MTKNLQRNMADANTQYQLDTIKHHVNFDPTSRPSDKEWRNYPELPTSSDLNPDWDNPEHLAEIRRLLPNTWRVPWQSKDTYLETHYRLQREEAITMLRYSIRKFKGDPTMTDDNETCVYTRVFIRGYLMTRLGPMCQVQFSTERSGKKIRWTQTRRLTVGSLVVLSTAADGFETICMPAVVSDHTVRDGLDQNPPIIHIQWTDMNDAVMDPDEELVMIETRYGYFEAVRHAMVGLQHVANTETCLDKYLVQADKSDLSAKYVTENPRMDVRSLVHHIPNVSSMTEAETNAEWERISTPLEKYPVLDGFDSALSKYTNLDNSQLSAVNRILTKELAIVQGPPGTGKTFISVQALQILLNSQKRGSNVIVVAAQTNHAVDQILAQLIDEDINVVRLGGRTQSEQIKQHSLYRLRQRVRGQMSSYRVDSDFKNSENARKANIRTLEGIVGHIFPSGLMDPAKLLSEGIITESQHKSLCVDRTWIAPRSSPDGPTGLLADWLGDELVRGKQHDEKDPDFEAMEDSDSELEADHNDLDPDDCIVDDDANAGRIDGKFIPIKHGWTGDNPNSHTGDDNVIQRELCKANLWAINVKNRGAVYQHWQRQLLAKHQQEFRDLLAVNMKTTKNLKINRWYKDTLCIKSSGVEVIGCTTTGLCKYRGLLAALQPRTMLIEEAAETREANILSALYGSLQQLILVGDHQQLAPHADTPGLSVEPFCVRVSMFERLIKLQMPFTVLNTQRRMIPSLREILNPFYPHLQDHPVVTRPDIRAPVPGMAVPSWFFHHTWVDNLDENASRFNILEAEMVVQFMNYLLMNGVPASQITVLTFYRGQKKRILHQCKTKLRQWGQITNVFTVDSYQGEENEIVILSLVRSCGPNGPHKVGFLEDENRGVVSISRARRGFYIFGNMVNLTQANPSSWNMWARVRDVFFNQGRFGDNQLPIQCQTHRIATWMSHPEDWVNCHGGCHLKCVEKMSCGHSCGRQCHWVNHEKLICREPCERILRCGHRCQQVCGETCVCNCDAFTGAYAHDEFTPADAKPVSEIRYDQTRVAPFITADQRRAGAEDQRRAGAEDQQRAGVADQRRAGAADQQRAGAAVGGRGRGKGGRAKRDRGSRRGVGYGAVGGGDPGALKWATFNAEADDMKIQEAIVQANLAAASSAGPNGHTTTIRDTFRPVILDEHGKRSLGKAETREIKSTAPEKPKADLLDSYDPAEKEALETHPTCLKATPPPQRLPQAEVVVPVIVTLSHQLDGAEWEAASVASDGTKADRKKTGDLINL
ncbi:P-loop containing nucleoside triphosphate hydrolase protein [Hypoxylon sp. FL1284]|nr:P-loop containing nucleoside triphosphate hydrolase protein [Hypoxylon sp. FL1284]